MMTPVIQQEATGCAIASAAAIAGISYARAKKIANELGIDASDPALWSESNHVRRLLKTLGIKISSKQTPFINWAALPDCALLATKWHLEQGKPYWHWVVFVRDAQGEVVLDSKKTLTTNIRTDFGRIRPRWYIKVYKEQAR
jgi:hypothetical protein